MLYFVAVLKIRLSGRSQRKEGLLVTLLINDLERIINEDY
jgi:hypothetical protein